VSTAGPVLEPDVVAVLRAHLPDVAARTIDTLTADVAEYGDRLGKDLRETLETSVRMALAGFLHLATQQGPDAGTPPQAAVDAAYALGRGEARSGRTMAALLAAYRIGARVAWREWSSRCVEAGMPPDAVARFAELVFAYIDALSGASVQGHSDELALSGRVRQQYRERLGRAILEGEPEHRLTALAERADWEPPEALVAVLLPAGAARAAQPALPPGTLHLPGDAVGLAPPEDDGDDLAVLLVPGGPAGRRALLRLLRDRPAVVGPARPWTRAAASVERARRLHARHGTPRTLLDTEEHLAELVLAADAEALRDLRGRVLAPLADTRAQTADRLVETLRSWLLHHGRRDDVAADLVVHPQTVRYRMTQLRRLFGDALTDPQRLLELTVALGLPDPPAADPAAASTVSATAAAP
jgi:hypothetical protein